MTARRAQTWASPTRRFRGSGWWPSSSWCTSSSGIVAVGWAVESWLSKCVSGERRGVHSVWQRADTQGRPDAPWRATLAVQRLRTPVYCPLHQRFVQPCFPRCCDRIDRPLSLELCRCRGVVRRAWTRRRPQHDLLLGAAFRAPVPGCAREHRHPEGSNWRVDETYSRLHRQWTYIYRALDQHGQVVAAYCSQRRHATAAEVFLRCAIDETGRTPTQVTTDKAKCSALVLRVVLPAVEHRASKYWNNGLE